MSSGAKARTVKKGSDKDESRARRETRCITLRKEKREEGIDKRRRAPVGADAAGAVAAAGSTLPAELSLEHLEAY